MRVARVDLRDFRSYESAEMGLGDGVTVVVGPNGAGKTNLLEAVYVGCTGRSCRTSNDRELVRFGAAVARVELHAQGLDGPHVIGVGIEPGEGKRVRVDGVAAERLTAVEARPLAGVFLPDRLELVKGPPALRRAHLDQVVAALWPARASTRRAYSRALAQRNALVARVRAGGAQREALRAWDLELAGHGVALSADRAAATAELAPRFAELAVDLGLDGGAAIAYRPRSRAETTEALAAELAERVEADLERGFTTHGPHRDELAFTREGRVLRSYGSQGQQRLALLALLLAERDAIAVTRGAPPLMLLDDVMSELDGERRERLVARLLAEPGAQSVITTTDLAHVPGAGEDGVSVVRVQEGRVEDAVVA
ncbi:MAG: replication and repair protein RecF [Solirubrobacteraceae bacterium]|jgi:DNA replication and repair protein RecF|nr:replication and repair protein RecF [Solirubrobacteraceae bacterium]